MAVCGEIPVDQQFVKHSARLPPVLTATLRSESLNSPPILLLALNLRGRLDLLNMLNALSFRITPDTLSDRGL